MTTNTSSQTNIILELVAESCFETESDKSLFLKSYGEHPQEHYSLRHDARGYGGELLTGLQGVVSWLMGIAANTPSGIAEDVLKFWIYSQILKQLPNAKIKEADRVFKKIREYLEKQVK
jgi:hypothetical protein